MITHHQFLPDDTDLRLAAWRNRVVERYLRGTVAQEHPRAVLVVGQPGAGKHSLVEHIARRMVDHGYCALVDPAEIKYFHPSYAAEADREDREVMKRIGPQILEAADNLIMAAVRRKRNLVIVTELAQPDAAVTLLSDLKQSSYHISVVALCVDPQVSWARVQERLLRHQQQFEVGTWVCRQDHDSCCRRLVDSLEAVGVRGLADEVDIISRNGKCLLNATSKKKLTPGTVRPLFPWAEMPQEVDAQTASKVQLRNKHPASLVSGEPPTKSSREQAGCVPLTAREPKAVTRTGREISHTNGRKIRLGVFTTPGLPMTTGSRPPATSADVSDLPNEATPHLSRKDAQRPRKIKVGSFPAPPQLAHVEDVSSQGIQRTTFPSLVPSAESSHQALESPSASQTSRVPALARQSLTEPPSCSQRERDSRSQVPPRESTAAATSAASEETILTGAESKSAWNREEPDPQSSAEASTADHVDCPDQQPDAVRRRLALQEKLRRRIQDRE